MKSRNALRDVETRAIGLSHGLRRIYIEGAQAVRGGFAPGATYTRKIDESKTMLILMLAPGETGSHRVTPKLRGEKVIPVIDVHSEELIEKLFEGQNMVRIIVRPGQIILMPLASALRAKERLVRLKEKLTNGSPLTIGALTSGIGVLDRAIHEGFAAASLEARLAFANEIRRDCQEHAASRNPVHSTETIYLTMPMQELAFDEWVMSQIKMVDGLAIGIPCSAASKSGRTKNKISIPEDHPEVGHLVVPFLAIVARTSPIFIMMECVPEWLNTASASLTRSMLRDLGYDVHETVLAASDWNAIEDRRRMCLVAVTQGIDFDFDLEKPERQTRHFAEIMDDVPLDSPMWKPFSYIWDKFERDNAAGKGFAPRIIDEQTEKLPTLKKTLHKVQSDGAFIRHPTNPDLYRIPTVAEHARAKDIWPEMLEGVTQTFGHEVCGQAISTRGFISAAKHLAEKLKMFADTGVVQFHHPAQLSRIAA